MTMWIIVDNIIMFLALPYTFLIQIVMVQGEITKNVFTLYQVQRKKLTARRQKLKAEKKDEQADLQQNALKKKQFFEDEEEKKRVEAIKKEAVLATGERDEGALRQKPGMK